MSDNNTKTQEGLDPSDLESKSAKDVATQLVKEVKDFRDRNDERLQAIENGNTSWAKEINQELDQRNERIDELEMKLKRAHQQNEEPTDFYEAEHKALDSFIRDDIDSKSSVKDFIKEIKSGNVPSDVKAYTKDGYNHKTGFDFDNLPDNLKSYGRAIQKKALSTDSLEDGGVFSLPNFEMEVVKGIREMSPVRAAARVIPIGSGDSLTIPVRKSFIDSQQAGERENVSDTDTQKYRQVRIQTHERSASPALTRQMIEDSFMDIVAETRRDAVEEFAVQEGAQFINGNDVDEPEGILTNGNVGSTDSGSNSSFDFDDLIDQQTSLKQGYEGAWMFSRQTRGFIRKLKDNDNQYLWSPNLAANAPNTLLGDPYFLATDLASPASGSYSAGDNPVLYGDYQRGYYIVDRLGLGVLRDPYSNRPFIEIYMRRRYGGKVVLPEAIKKLTTTS